MPLERRIAYRSRLSCQRWRAANPKKVAAIIKRAKWRRFEQKYGIKIEEAERKLSEQGNCCKICKIPILEIGGGRGARIGCVDHCHSSNTFRGILCNNCNCALGFMGDDPNIAMACAVYLQDMQARLLAAKNLLLTSSPYSSQ